MASVAGVPKRACEGVLPACQYEENNGGTAIRPFFASLVELTPSSEGALLTSWRTLQDRGAIFERYCTHCPVLDADRMAEGAALLALARTSVAARAPAGNPLFQGTAAHVSGPIEAERQLLREAQSARLKLDATRDARERMGALLALDPARASRRLGARVAAGEISVAVARGLNLSYERAAKGHEAELARHRETLDDPSRASPNARGAAEARNDELTYLSKFRARVQRANRLVDPRRGRAWTIARIDESEPAPSEASAVPVGVASRFVLFSRSWWLLGMQRPRLVVEARTLARSDRYARLGFDDEPFDVADINRALDERPVAGAPTRALALVSLTGWTDAAIERVHAGWEDAALVLLLVDARTGEVHAHDALRASHDSIIRLFVPETRAEEARRAERAIINDLLLAVHDEVAARDVVRASGVPAEAIEAAMAALAHGGWGRVEKRKDGASFRRREGKDLGELS